MENWQSSSLLWRKIKAGKGEERGAGPRIYRRRGKADILVDIIFAFAHLFPSGFMHSVAFLMLYGIALATEGWGVVASLKIYPPFDGAAVSTITLVIEFGFVVSRPCLTLKVQFLFGTVNAKIFCHVPIT